MSEIFEAICFFSFVVTIFFGIGIWSGVVKVKFNGGDD